MEQQKTAMQQLIDYIDLLDSKNLPEYTISVATRLKAIELLEDEKNYINRNSGLTWLLSLYENADDNYIEAINFIIEIAEMPFYKRMFCVSKIIRFLNKKNFKKKLIDIKK